MLSDEPHLAVLKGELAETPSYTRYEQNGRERIHTSARLRAMQISTDDGVFRPVEATVLATVPGMLPDKFFSGRTVILEGVVSAPKGALAEGLFDYRKYLATQNIYYHFQTRQTNDWKLDDPATELPLPVADRFLRWGKNVIALGLPNEDEALRLSWSMSLGWRPGLNSDASVPFIRTGTMHIFAISGLHVALIAAILVQLLKFIRIPRAACALVIIPLIWFYTGATGWQPSAIRSTIMSSIVVLGWSLKRPSNLLNSLLGAALFILIWQPEQLFQASFQLSFFVVLSMALLLQERWSQDPRFPAWQLGWLIGLHPLSRLKAGWKPTAFIRWWPGDELLPPSLEPLWLRCWRKSSAFLKTSLLTSGAAWIGSLPLIMYYFSIVTPISLLANLIVVPLSSMALTCNLASFCTGTWFSSATTLFNHAGWFFMLCLNKLSWLFSSWRCGYFYTRPPSPTAVLCYYIFMVMAATGCLARRRLRYLTLSALAIGLCIYFIPVLQSRRTLRLTVLPVGGGTIYIDDRPTGECVLVDTADERGAKTIVSPFLHAQGINSLESLFLTHASVRHSGGVLALLSDTPPREIITSAPRFRSRPYNDALRVCEAHGIRRLTKGEGDIVGHWRILHPDQGTKLAVADDQPLILKGEYAGLHLLLLSELGTTGQAMLSARHSEDLKADILIAGLPAHDEPLKTDLLQAISPKIIILCTSEYPASARGSRKLRERLEAFGVPIYYSDEARGITLTLSPNQYQIKTMSGETIQWQAGEMPKGTVPLIQKTSAPRTSSTLEEDSTPDLLD